MTGRKDELLAAARERLANEQNGGGRSSSAPEIRYRGQVLRQGSAGTPGSGIGASRPAPTSASGSDDVRASLQKLKELYHDGLITRAEAEKKRAEILGRL